jgi:hypothetical protein
MDRATKEIDVMRYHERNVLPTVGRLRTLIRDTIHMPDYGLGTGEFAEAEELAEWLRWRVTEGWRSPENPTWSHFDDLVRMLAAEVLDHFELWVREVNGEDV